VVKALTSIAALVYFAVPSCLAQSTWATIAGRVVDATQAALPGAHLRFYILNANDAIEAETDANGRFSLTFLPPGNYTVEVAADGFKPLTTENIVVRGSDSIDLRLTLQVGEISGKVTVAVDSDALQPSSASRSHPFDTEKVKGLPTVGRQGYNLIGLVPGALLTQDQMGTGGFTGLRNWDSNGNYVLNGGLQGTNQFLLNGAPISLTGRWQFAPSVEAVQEVRVMTNTYDAQYGRTGGGTVNTTLRAGNDTWHGAAYEFLHNARLDANSSQNNSLGAPRGKHNTDQFGGTLGGPVRAGKDFTFFSFEGFKETAPYPVVSDTPPMDLRSGHGFFNYGIRIYDPLTTRTCRPGVDTPAETPCFSTYIRSPFPRDVIPESRISAVGQNVLALYPAPNGGGLTQNYTAAANASDSMYIQPIARWDHNFSDKDRFYALFTYQHSTESQSSSGFPPEIDAGTGKAEQTGQNYIAAWTRVISPNTVADLRASFGRFTVFAPESACTGCVTADQLGIANFPHAPTVQQNSAPRIDLDSATSIIGNSFVWNSQNQIDLASGVSHVRGRHNIHFGLEYAYSAVASAGPGRANGEFYFTRQWTQQYVSRSSGVLDGSGVADLLLGLPYSGYIDYNDNSYRTWPYFAGYVQDTWKLRRNLTLNLGFRYDVQIPFLERFNRANQGFDLNSVNPLSAQILANWRKVKAAYDATHPQYLYPDPPEAIYGGRTFATPGNRRPYDTDWTDLQPRVGVAWNIHSKTAFRAGAGIFYRTATQMNYTDGFNQQTSYTRSTDGGLHPAAGLTGPYSLESPFPNGISSPTGSALGLRTNIGNIISFDGRQRPIPRTYEYSAGFQQELPWKVIADVAYAGSVTVHDSLPVQIDNPSASQFAKGTSDPFYLNRQVPSPYFGILPVTSDLGSGNQVTAYNLLRPYPVYEGIAQTNSATARYRYDSFQVQLEKRVFDNVGTGAMSFQFAYTFSKSFAADHRLNDWNLAERPIHELSNQDKPQSIAFAGTWELPFGWGRRWLNDVPRAVGAFTNGWNVDWIFTYSSGYPVGMPDANFLCSSYEAPGGQTAGHWFNNDPKCYQSRPLYTLKTTPDVFPNIRTPTAPQFNVSVAKTFWFGEKYVLQVRGEAYNAANSPIFPGPDTNFKDARFGQLPLQQQNFPRYVQVAAKFVF
jgi:hypothetical protein